MSPIDSLEGRTLRDQRLGAMLKKISTDRDGRRQPHMVQGLLAALNEQLAPSFTNQ